MSQSLCPRGETLTIRVAVVSSAGVAVDLSGETIVLGWDAVPSSSPLPQAIREDGDATGVVEFEISTIDLAADQYQFDVWREDDAFARTLLVDRSFVTMIGSVANLNIAPTITMVSIASSVPTGELAISGTVMDTDGTLTGASIAITVNGVAQAVTVNLAAGSWDTTLTLTAGAKTIVATVTDSRGLTAAATRATTAA
jgi:hypothetical protein